MNGQSFLSPTHLTKEPPQEHTTEYKRTNRVMVNSNTESPDFHVHKKIKETQNIRQQHNTCIMVNNADQILIGIEDKQKKMERPGQDSLNIQLEHYPK